MFKVSIVMSQQDQRNETVAAVPAVGFPFPIPEELSPRGVQCVHKADLSTQLRSYIIFPSSQRTWILPCEHRSGKLLQLCFVGLPYTRAFQEQSVQSSVPVHARGFYPEVKGV